MRHTKITLAVTAALAVFALTLAGCGVNSTSTPPAVFSSAIASPAVSADAAQLESELLAAWQKDFSPAHPVRSSEAAVRAVFPHGDSAVIASYAVQTLSTGMTGTSTAAVAARHHWAQAVVGYALGQGATATASASAS